MILEVIIKIKKKKQKLLNKIFIEYIITRELHSSVDREIYFKFGRLKLAHE